MGRRGPFGDDLLDRSLRREHLRAGLPRHRRVARHGSRRRAAVALALSDRLCGRVALRGRFVRRARTQARHRGRDAPFRRLLRRRHDEHLDRVALRLPRAPRRGRVRRAGRDAGGRARPVVGRERRARSRPDDGALRARARGGADHRRLDHGALRLARDLSLPRGPQPHARRARPLQASRDAPQGKPPGLQRRRHRRALWASGTASRLHGGRDRARLHLHGRDRLLGGRRRLRDQHHGDGRGRLRLVGGPAHRLHDAGRLGGPEAPATLWGLGRFSHGASPS